MADVNRGNRPLSPHLQVYRLPLAAITSIMTRITGHALGKTRAWERLAFVADRFGHRLSGSRALEDTIDWAVETMAKDGLSNARREQVMVPHWVRGKESLRVLGERGRELRILGLGMSVGTKGALRGELVVVGDLEAL